MRRAPWAVAVLALALVSCGGDDPADEPRNPPAENPLALRAGGLGSAGFGDGVDSVLRVAVDELGDPDADTGWLPVADGTCQGQRVRAVDWGALRLGFTDGETTYEAVGTEHFFTWEYDGERGDEPELATEEGLRLGESEDDLVARYGSAATVIPATPGQPTLYQIDRGDDRPMEAELDADEEVTLLRGGVACRAEAPQAPAAAQ